MYGFQVILKGQQTQVLVFLEVSGFFSFLNPSDCQLTEFADEGPTPTDREGQVYSFCNTKITESNLEGGESFELK